VVGNEEFEGVGLEDVEEKKRGELYAVERREGRERKPRDESGISNITIRRIDKRTWRSA